MTNRIGLIGGVSWVSTMEYYRRLNVLAQQIGGGHTSANVAVVSLNFEELLGYQRRGDEDGEYAMLLGAAIDLSNIGAKHVLICSNTTSRTCDRLQEKLGISVINIIDATVNHVLAKGYSRVGLVATQFVMEQTFYRSRFRKSGIEVFVPKLEYRRTIHSSIYDDLCHNRMTHHCRWVMSQAMDNLRSSNVESIILGCTEIPLVFPNEISYCGIPLIDSIDVHIGALATFQDPQPKASK